MENKTFMFHVHFPEGIEKVGQPVVLGDVKELGSWKNTNVKLNRPFRQNPTYWQSNPITISVSNIGNDDIHYKYALIITENIVFEGNSNQENRTLDIKRKDQFDIWKN